MIRVTLLESMGMSRIGFPRLLLRHLPEYGKYFEVF